MLSGASLFLDLDGTLVEIASRPDGIAVDERLHRLLSCLSQRLGGRLALLSGRPAHDIRAFFPDASFAIAGSHGAEILWPDGRTRTPSHRQVPPGVLERIQSFEAAHPQVLVERKPYGFAFHYRLSPADEQACHIIAKEIAGMAGYGIQTGKKVIELKMMATDKGDALASLMSQAPMHGTRPVFIGDDDTDEAGFRMAKQLGGAGILVGPWRATEAVYNLAGVDQTLHWLAESGEMAS